MKTQCLILMLSLLITGNAFSVDWPAYHRATIITEVDVNESDAVLNADKLITNSKINCVSDWTIKFIEDDGYFEIWMDSNPQDKKMGHNKSEFLFQQSSGIFEIACEETHLTLWEGKRIFAEDLPKDGDIFYIHITANGYEYGDITGIYCDCRPEGDFHGYHSGSDIGNVATKSDPVVQECHIYPVRDGTLVKVSILGRL
ncbi:hypothetical protein K8T06_07830 [bacterium]|nr:hypothetical protein [bacterium]